MKTNADVDRFMRGLKQWRAEAAKLRDVLHATKLDEEYKWRLPCYSHQGKNIAIIQPFKACLALMFFKGALLKDTKKRLVPNGPNSNSSLRLEFRSVEEIASMKSTIKSYVAEAIKAEESGAKVEVKKKATPMPEELTKAFAKQPKFKKAFGALTPGRQRAYLLHFNGAKQSETRTSRIEKCIPRILEGKGLLDR